MRVAILALRRCCDYSQIGGAESVVRRLALGLGELGHTVDYVLYGDDKDNLMLVTPQVSVRYCATFAEALFLLSSGYDHVLTVHIAAADRPRFAWFQRRHHRTMRFHKVMLGTPYSLFRWLAFLAEVRANTRCGQVLTTSQNAAAVLARLRVKHTALLPPVPRAYFERDGGRPDDTISLTYMGRNDPEKGASRAFALLRAAGRLDGIHTRVAAYSSNGEAAGVTLQPCDSAAVSTVGRTKRILYSEEVEQNVIRLLHATDILALPYKSMLGTIDPPLLLLEAMAAGCACLVCDAGNVRAVYGDSEFVIPFPDYVDGGLSLLGRIRGDRSTLERERTRVRRRAAALGFNTASVVERLVNALR